MTRNNKRRRFLCKTWHTDQRPRFTAVPIRSRILHLNPNRLTVILQFHLNRKRSLHAESGSLKAPPLCTLKCRGHVYRNRLTSLYCTAGSFSGVSSSCFLEELLPQQQYFKQPQQPERMLSTPRVMPMGDRFSFVAETLQFQKDTKY